MAVGICNSNQHDNLNEDMIVAVVNCNLTNKLQINPKKFRVFNFFIYVCISAHLTIFKKNDNVKSIVFLLRMYG